MRAPITMLAALAFAALSAGAASAQTPLSCAVAPQAVCEDAELLALESERASLVQQLAAADPQHAAIAGEQTWSDGLSACGEDIECYRTAYLNHNQTLRASAGGAHPDAAASEPALEAPDDAPTVEEQIAIDEVQAERLREPREDSQHAYVATGLPGWGFFTTIGVTLFICWWLMRALKRHRREMRAEEARLRGRW